ncbi:MAG: MBL fold metallo-hydrolase [Oscillospiraceae bacterium]|nr:MBL fold metallo-hydrolase [Oscillospiraceae bacterium]
MKKKILLTSFIIMLIILLTACQATGNQTQSGNDIYVSTATSIETAPVESLVTESIETDSKNHLSTKLYEDEIPLVGEASVEALETETSIQKDEIQSDISNGELTIYFIDVGQADSALVVCEGYTMLIDGGNVADSNLVFAFLKKHNIEYLDYIIATHGHEDHVGGLAGALNYASVGVAFCPITTYNANAFRNFVKYLENQEKSITVPNPGDSFMLGSASVDILAPVKRYTNANNMSIVLKITFGETSFLFAGDAEREAEQDILAQGYDLSATVLKIGHHGSETSTTYPFLREIMPQFAIISCGKNKYGHPSEDLLSRLRDAEIITFRTDLQGDIICVSDGKTVTFTTERNLEIETNPTITEEDDLTEQNTSAPLNDATLYMESYAYIGNINSMRFHYAECRTLPTENNRTYFLTREAAIEANYSPCGNCKP